MADTTAQTIIEHEGFRASPYWDRNAWRVGFGSDTWTDENGKSHRVTKDMEPISRETAMRDLERRIPEFQRDGIIPYVGRDAWNKLPEQAQAAITSLAYNYGSLDGLPSLQRAIKSGNLNTISQAIGNRGVDNGGINAKRRSAEAQMVADAKVAPEPASMSAETAIARTFGSPKSEPDNGGTKSLMAYAPNTGSTKQGDPGVPLYRPNARDVAEYSGATIGLKANDAAQGIARAAQQAKAELTPQQMLNNGTLSGQLADYIQRQQAPQGQPLTTRKVQTVPIDPRTGMPPVSQPAATSKSALQEALARYIERRNNATETARPLSGTVSGLINGTIGEIQLPNRVTKTASPVPIGTATKVGPSGYIQGVEPAIPKRLTAEPTMQGSMPPNTSGMPSYTVGANGELVPETNVPLPRRRPGGIMANRTFGDELLPGQNAINAQIEAEQARRNAIAAQDPFAFAGEPPKPTGFLAAMQEGMPVINKQVAQYLSRPGREPTWFEQQTGNKGSFGDMREMVGKINTGRLIDYFTNNQGQPGQTAVSTRRDVGALGWPSPTDYAEYARVASALSQMPRSQPSPSSGLSATTQSIMANGIPWWQQDNPGQNSISSPTGSPFWSYN